MLLKEVIEIPKAVHDGDFVLKLAEGVADEDALRQTADQYVVTPRLVENFREAMRLIGDAVENNQSKAAILHGSFGSGKSHFMAMLHLLLQRHPAARAKPMLGPIVQESDAWNTGDKKYLLVPYHMIEKTSCEQAILAGYAEHVRELHPEAPVPAVYRAEGLFRDAAGLRESFGDDAFFSSLGAAAPVAGDAGWGAATATGWTAARYDAAVAAPSGGADRSALISALIATHFKNYGRVQADGKDTFIDLDNGLSVISRHAKTLGYAGIVLFLDELILWLSAHAADMDFVRKEIQKLAKLVEAQVTDRPVPIVSFIARQRDLRDLVGGSEVGAVQAGFEDIFSHWKGRFSTVALADQNLREIAKARLLRPNDDAAHAAIEAAFTKTTTSARGVMDILLNNDSSAEDFRTVFPFSPALVDTLVDVSGLLQRNRTSLKVMLQMLSKRRDTLELGEIIPVGDLFDQVTQTDGGEAFSGAWKGHFDQARKLYDRQLYPVLLQDLKLTAAEAEALDPAEPKARRLRSEGRLLKTALLAALVPGVGALQGLTAEKLMALNWGAVKDPFGSNEIALTAQKLRGWAAACSAIKLGGDADRNPTVTVHLEGVDTDAILKAASPQDNLGNRVQVIKRHLFEMLDLGDPGQTLAGTQEATVQWRGTRRLIDVTFGNIREMAPGLMKSSGDRWKLVIDYPVDNVPKPADADRKAIANFEQQNPGGTDTQLWTPAFLNDAACRDLGKLVLIEHVLRGDNLDRQYATTLTPEERGLARNQLKSQGDRLTVRVKEHLCAAYGIRGESQAQASLVDGADGHTFFPSLRKGFTPKAPAAANLRDAFVALMDQVFTHQFPAHPRLNDVVTTAKLKKIRVILEDAAGQGQRAEVTKTDRELMTRIAEPLELGRQGEIHFALGQTWREQLDRYIAASGSSEATVGDLREQVNDRPEKRGLTREVSDLILIAYALQTDRSFAKAGATVEPDIGRLDDDVVLRPQPMPEPSVWDRAVAATAAVFGQAVPRNRTANNVALLHQRVAEVAAEHGPQARELLTAITGPREVLKMNPGEGDRVAQARAVASLLGAMADRKPAEAVIGLGRFESKFGDQALGAALKAGPALAALKKIDAHQIESLGHVPDDNPLKVEARAVLDRLRGALDTGELAQPLAPVVAQATAEAGRLISAVMAGGVKTPPAPPPVTPPVVTPPLTTPAGWTAATRNNLSVGGLSDLLKEMETQRTRGFEVEIEQIIYRTRKAEP